MMGGAATALVREVQRRGGSAGTTDRGVARPVGCTQSRWRAGRFQGGSKEVMEGGGAPA